MQRSLAQGRCRGHLDFGRDGGHGCRINLAAERRVGKSSRPRARGSELSTASAFLASNHAWDAGLKSLKDMGGHTVGIVQVGGPIHYGG